MKLSTKIFTVLGIASLAYGIGAFNVLGFVLTSAAGTPTGACGYGYGYGTSYGYGTVACPSAAGGTFSSSTSAPTVATVATAIVNQILSALDGNSTPTTTSTVGYGYGSTTPAVVACVPAKLSDVKSSKFATQITTLVSKCIVRGNNVVYSPKARVTAAEFSKIVLKSFGLASNYTDSFQKAKALKIVPSTMKPSTQLTKTQAYTILKNAFSVSKKKSLTKIPSISRGYITREESAQLVVNAIGAKNIPTATSKE